MQVPKRFRPDEAEKRDRSRGLTPEFRQKKRELEKGIVGGARAWAGLSGSPRYLAVLVILFVVLGALLTRQASRSKISPAHRLAAAERAAADLATLRTALDMFRKDCGRYPSARESLPALMRNPRIPGWDGPYIRNLIPDPWRQSYRYRTTDDFMRLSSDGPDGKSDTADDIQAPDPAPASPALPDPGSRRT